MTALNPVDLYRHDFASFVRFVFHELYPGKRYINAWHVEVVADALMRCVPGREQRLIINVPPRYLKSLCASIAWPLFVLARFPGLRIFVCAGTRELAGEFNELRERLFRSKRFQQVLDVKPVPITGGWRFSNGSEIVQSIVRRSQIGRGADIIIIDDPISPSRARNPKECAIVNAWYDSEILPRLNNKASAGVIVVMQRLAQQDLSGHLLGGDERWRHLSLSAVAKTAEKWDLADGRVFRREAGEALCEPLETREALLQRLDQIGGLNFFAQYLQAPTTTADGSNYRRFRRPTLVYDGWKPGMEMIPAILFGKLNIACDIRHEYFDGPDPDDRTGLRELTEEEFDAAFYSQQTRLLAECRSARSGTQQPG